jgi:hypothetical protein
MIQGTFYHQYRTRYCAISELSYRIHERPVCSHPPKAVIPQPPLRGRTSRAFPKFESYRCSRNGLNFPAKGSTAYDQFLGIDRLGLARSPSTLKARAEPLPAPRQLDAGDIGDAAADRHCATFTPKLLREPIGIFGSHQSENLALVNC